MALTKVTQTVSSITASDIGLGNVTNESKATMFTSPTFTGTVSGVTATMVGLGNVTNESKATMFTSPTFTGTVSGASATFSGSITVSTNNANAGGIILADDGDIVDLNTGYCAMRFSSGVQVYSGNRTGSAVVTLTSGGEVRASNEITAFYSSDSRLKENITVIEGALDKLSKIQGVMFDWTQEHIDRRGGEDGYFVRRHDTGVIAQQVQDVLPEVVVEREDGYLAVKYEKMMGLVIQAINELSEEVKSIKKSLE